MPSCLVDTASACACVADDLAELHRFELREVIGEAVSLGLLGTGLLMFALIAGAPSRVALILALVPFFVHRLLAPVICDCCFGACGVGWGAPFGPMLPAPRQLARLCRIVDAVGVALSLALAGLQLGLNAALGVYLISWTVTSIPLWCSSLIQAAVVALAASKVARRTGGVEWWGESDASDHQRLAQRPSRARRCVGCAGSGLGPRCLLLLVNAVSVPLCLKLDSRAGSDVSWGVVLAPAMAAVQLLMVAALAVAAGALCGSREGCAPLGAPPPSASTTAMAPAFAWMRLRVNVVVAATLAAVAAASLAVLQTLSQVLQGMDAAQAAFNPPVRGQPGGQSQLVVALPPRASITLVVPFLVANLILCGAAVAVYGPLAVTWRVLFAQRWGILTPTASAREAYTRHLARGGGGQPLAAWAPQPLPHPSHLLRVGCHRYRRLLEGEDVEAALPVASTSGAVQPAPLPPGGAPAAVGIAWHTRRRAMLARSLTAAAQGSPGKPAPRSALRLHATAGAGAAAGPHSPGPPSPAPAQAEDTAAAAAPSRPPTAPPQPQPSEACGVCAAAPCDAVLLECGHAGLCLPCALRLHTGRRWLCPWCRAPVAQAVRLAEPLAPGAVVRVLPLPSVEAAARPQGGGQDGAPPPPPPQQQPANTLGAGLGMGGPPASRGPREHGAGLALGRAGEGSAQGANAQLEGANDQGASAQGVNAQGANAQGALAAAEPILRSQAIRRRHREEPPPQLPAVSPRSPPTASFTTSPRMQQVVSPRDVARGGLRDPPGAT